MKEDIKSLSESEDFKELEIASRSGSVHVSGKPVVLSEFLKSAVPQPLLQIFHSRSKTSCNNSTSFHTSGTSRMLKGGILEVYSFSAKRLGAD